jgi:hypothetical protein
VRGRAPGDRPAHVRVFTVLATGYEHGRDFIADLDKFLGALPKGWPYGVEMRNRNWLKPEYFECLARHQVAHVYNSWEAMPSVGEQMALPGSRTNPDLVAARSSSSRAGNRSRLKT